AALLGVAAAPTLLAAGTRQLPAAAQSAAPAVDLRLLSQRPWLTPGDRLGVRLRVDNVGAVDLDGFLLRVGVYDRVTSRSNLLQSFGGTPEIPASAFSKYFSGTRLHAGESTTIVLREHVGALASLDFATEGGDFPLTFYLYDASGTRLMASLTTTLIYYPQPPPTPLNIVTVVPIDALPAEGPDGVFHADPSGGFPLAEALSPSGWLTGLLEALDSSTRPPPAPKPVEKRHRRHVKRDRHRKRVRAPTPPRPVLRLALVPEPRLIQEIADMANGYTQELGGQVTTIAAGSPSARAAARYLHRLASLLARPGVQTVLTPYSSPDLPTLDHNFDLEHLARQLTVGQAVLQSKLGVSVGAEWLFPPAGRLDAPTLDDLQLDRAAKYSFVSESSLQQPTRPALAGCPSAFATFACPVRIRSDASSSIGFQADSGLQERLAALKKPGDDRLDLQRLLAETAMIQAETPGVKDRVVQATVPPLWHPSTHLATTFYRYLTRAPWLHSWTPQDALRSGVTPVAKHLLPSARPIRNQPDQSYFSQVAAAETMIQHYSVTLPAAVRIPPLLQRLRQNVLVAQSRLWWSDPVTLAEGASYAIAARNGAARQLQQVSIGGVNEISMTSQRAEIPFVLSSRADHPVTVNVVLLSPKLGFDRSQLKGVVIQHGTQQISVEATARASGIFPVEVKIETPDGYVIASKSIQVRSTNFNQIALGLTLGAFVFLVVFYLASAIKKRRGRAGGGSPGTSTA
ncbi:MAG: DUF6049 family protein, partial [Actinomycetota bacterium]|nr:DUF6049 family protein [Actinomycetota bacterium]